MTTLYHGSYIAVSSPFVGLGRKKVDFGQGFYLTKLREQAASWAICILNQEIIDKHLLYKSSETR